MRSALYYPHTEIRSMSLLKSALMLWDEIQVITPFPGYRPHYDNAQAAEAWELIGRCHPPSGEEKKQVHELVEDFATRVLPEAFSLRSTAAPSEIYEVYPQKLLPETWEVLQEAGLAGLPLANSDYPTTGPTGLSLMSLVADCCAGETLVRVTDRSVAYAGLSGLLTEVAQGAVQASDVRDYIIALNVSVADADSIGVDKWIAFRRREAGASDGHFIRDLRHRFVKHIGAQAASIVQAKKKSDIEELKRQFEQDASDDFRALKEALKIEAVQMIPTKEVMFTVLAGAAAMLAFATSGIVPMPDVITPSGAVASIGGLMASRGKYIGARRKVLREHPLAYLYEAAGGLRL